ncbi:hypothetical protein A2999_01320 [Candidatus Wolfebacteria bacterium RIFCSPLOWO2_01_FULL_38_11]|uniref:Band 7 domain-containing protein n=1 Tax=Candidatus Wolfebacteria bacterium RIFCSPLOWO2_01_FULL_38_11 TaxID=1802556 RepID=A0A1F8DT73_9BACT|nr:MAG: hypothetical protein A2999_01320 [Candidatus Wolfebacteria bacterium RIFCSPLOWO2_01_FULL_38_11]
MSVERMTKWIFLSVAVILNFFLIIVEYVWLSKYSIMIGEWECNLGWATFFAQLLYNILSFRIVGPTELGALLFFGRPIRDVDSGLRFVPFLVCRLARNTKNAIEIELPARPELIYRAERGKEEVVPENLLKLGFRPPIRVQFGWPGIKLETEDLGGKIKDPKTKEEEREKAIKTKELYDALNKLIIGEIFEGDPLNVRMTVETPLVVRLKISSLVNFLEVFGSIENAEDHIQDIAVAMLNREFSKITPAVAQHHLGTFSNLIKDDVIERIRSDKGSDCGVNIMTVLLRPFVYSHEFNAAIQEPAEERAKKQATVTAAEAQKRKDILEGEGQGAKEKAIIDGRTKGLTNMAKELGVLPLAVLSAETARAITANPGQKTIIAGTAGFNDLMAVGAALGEVFRKEDKK